MKKQLAIIGLGYVGLPLAVEFAKKYRVIGFDINSSRVDDLRTGLDSTMEVEGPELTSVIKNDLLDSSSDSTGLLCTTEPALLSTCDVFIITVPTPTDKHKRPVLTPLLKASQTVGEVLKSGDYVVYESTVYPGVTEEECVPVLEQVSGLRLNKDFYVGYSPERINPGDKEHTVSKILKVTSGSTPESARFIDNLYREVITAGTFSASSIRVAEAAKVIENSQRDINIAFVNELAKIFSLLDIDTHAVLAAAQTKWNFLPFKPGLVGGHCIGVDPYYLAQKAQEVGYHPEIILGGRRLNDSMGKFVASEVIKLLLNRSTVIRGAKILILGITFKENCPDIRNTRVIDVVNELLTYHANVDVFDPWASPNEVKEHLNLELNTELSTKYDAIIHAVAHHQFLNMDLRSYLTTTGVLYDVKGALDVHTIDARL